MSAILPERYWEKPRRRLSELEAGETAHTNFLGLRVSLRGECFLNPEEELMEDGPLTIRVERREDGFHVAIPQRAGKTYFSWEQREFREDECLLDQSSVFFRCPFGEGA